MSFAYLGEAFISIGLRSRILRYVENNEKKSSVLGWYNLTPLEESHVTYKVMNVSG